MFYNGFNLLIDTIIATASGLLCFKLGWLDGMVTGVDIAVSERPECEYKSWHPVDDCDHVYDSYCHKCGVDSIELSINDVIREIQEGKANGNMD